MLGAGHDVTHDGLDVESYRSGPGSDALGRPLGVKPVVGGHMLLHRRIPHAAAGRDAHVEGDSDVVVEHLDRPGRREYGDLFAGEGVGNAVVVAILPAFHVIIGLHGGETVVRDLVAAFRQRFKGRFVDLFEALDAALGKFLETHAVVDGQHLPNSRIQVDERADFPVAKGSEHAGVQDVHRILDEGLVARFAGPCWDDDGLVVPGEHFIFRIDFALEFVALLHGAFQAVRHDRRGDAAEELQGVAVAQDEVVPLLGYDRFGVGVAARSQDGDEDLGFHGESGDRIVPGQFLSREVHVHAVAGQVLDVRSDFGIGIDPGLEMMAELGIGEAIGVFFNVLIPQDVPRDAHAGQLLDHVGEKGHGSRQALVHGLLRAAQTIFKHAVGKFQRLVQAEPGGFERRKILGDGRP